MAYAETRGRRSRGMYRDAEGRLRSAGWATSKKAAKALAQTEELKIRAGLWHDPDAGKMTFSTYFEHHWMTNRPIAPTTAAGYWSYYRTEYQPTFGDMELRAITRPVVQRWIMDMEKRGELIRSTQRAKFRVFKAIMGAQDGVSALRDGLIEKNPCEGVTLFKVPTRRAKVYTVAQVDAIMEQLDAWWKPLALVLSDTGCRWGEIQGLEAGDFVGDGFTIQRTCVELSRTFLQERGLGDGTTRWYIKDMPKDAEERTVRVSPEVASVIEQLVRSRELFPGDRIFGMHDGHGKLLRTPAWPHGRPVDASHWRDVWRRAHPEGITPLKPHALRGSMISWLILSNTDLGAVMDRAGHSKMATTQAYFDQFSDAGDRALAGLARARAAARGE